MPLSEGTGEPVAAWVTYFGAREAEAADRLLAVEMPVQVTFAGVPYAVMMMTPGDFEDFAYGFCLTEGIVEDAGEIRTVRPVAEALGVRLDVELAGSRLHAHLARQRRLSGRTGCGLCGIEDFEALPRARPRTGKAPCIASRAIERALGELEGRQFLNQATRAVHGAAWASLAGEIAYVREDVGRHNALDKLIGALLRAGLSPAEGFVLITSRASYEMVEKVGSYGARTLVAISAPTSLALDRARRLDLTLIGIARRDSMTVFHGMERVVAKEVAA